MTGFAIVLGNHRSPHATYIQAAGNGKCIRRPSCASDPHQPVAPRVLVEICAGVNVQTTHTAICNRNPGWTGAWTMALDGARRIGEDTLRLTHEFLSLMLAVRRAGVTDALNALRKQGLIFVSARANQTVRDARNGAHRQAKPTAPGAISPFDG